MKLTFRQVKVNLVCLLAPPNSSFGALQMSSIFWESCLKGKEVQLRKDRDRESSRSFDSSQTNAVAVDQTLEAATNHTGGWIASSWAAPRQVNLDQYNYVTTTVSCFISDIQTSDARPFSSFLYRPLANCIDGSEMAWKSSPRSIII